MVMATLSDLSSNLEPLPLYTTNNIPNDAQFGQMAYMKLIEADTARAAGLESGTENVLVAVVDDGFAQHPDVK